MIDIIPSILTDSPKKFANLLNQAKNTKRIHVDIIDGKFVDNKTIEPSILNSTNTSSLLDFHLMVVNPIAWVERCVQVCADRIIGHVEKMDDQGKFIDTVHENNTKAGLAIDLGTKVSELDLEILGKVDVVLVMSVKVGYGGQKFDERALDVIVELSKLRNIKNHAFRICDDGGITIENIDDSHFLGVNEVVIGRKIFKGDIDANILRYQTKAHIIDE